MSDQPSTPEGLATPPAVQSWIWWTLPTLFVLLLGSVFLPAPFTGDQALYSLGGRAILDGQLLYTDFWDIKHPGVHLFYANGHALFGWTGLAAETQIHLLEMLLWIACGLFLQKTLRSRLSHPLVAAAAPLTTSAAYYASASHRGLTQIEVLPGLFLALAWCLSLPRQTSRSTEPAESTQAPQSTQSPESTGDLVLRPLAVGALAATAVVFHGHMFPVPLVLLGVAYVGRRDGWRQLAWSLGGLVAVLAVFAGFFALRSGLSGLWEVYVSYPFEAARQVPAERQGLDRVLWPLSEFLKTYLPWLLLAALAFSPLPVASNGRLSIRIPKTDRAVLQPALWGAAALAVIIFETRTSWPFHYLYFVMPVGLLAIFGLDRSAVWLADLWPGAQRMAGPLALAAAAIALAPSLVNNWQDQAGPLIQHIRTAGVSDFDGYRNKHSDKYAGIRRATSFLQDPGALAGPIYVFGDPLHHTLSGRGQALKRSGWGWEVYLSEHWSALPGEIERKRPAYLLVESRYSLLFREKAPEALQLIETLYEPIENSETQGVWYRLVQP